MLRKRIGRAATLILCLGFGNLAHAASITGLGKLYADHTNSQATAISADGSTVVGYSWSILGGEAFRWRSVRGMMGLGTLRTHRSRSYRKLRTRSSSLT